LTTTIGGVASWPPKRPQPGVFDRSNQRKRIASSQSIVYSRMMPFPPRQRPAPPESGRNQ
jgi:hypothetical protein